MKTAKEINDIMKESAARISAHKATIEAAKKDITINNIIAARKGDKDAAGKLDKANAATAAAERAINHLEIFNAVLRDNKRQAIAAAAAPAVLEVLRKYNGKPYGEKTRAKISEEVRQLCGCRFYIRDFSPYASEAGYLIPEDVPGVNRYGWGADDLTLYTTYDAATKSRPLLLDENNKINAAAAELLKLGYCAPYVEDACARAQEIEAARAALEDARTAYNTAVEKYNSLIPSTIKHQEQSNARF